jgi:hypothetical protein
VKKLVWDKRSFSRNVGKNKLERFFLTSILKGKGVGFYPRGEVLKVIHLSKGQPHTQILDKAGNAWQGKMV